jgi:hypothetical protein
MRRLRRRLGILLLLLLIAAGGAGYWWHRQPREKSIPAFGGADISVQLPDQARYLQNDPRWSAVHMGSATGNTLRMAGCTVTSVATAMTNLGLPFNPGELTAALTTEHGFTPQSWLIWDAVSRVSKGALRVDYYKEPSQSDLDACLVRGDYPIVKFRIFKVIPHWAVIVGKQHGTYFARDPLIDEAEPIPLTRRTPVIYAVRCIGKAQQPSS